MYSNKYSYKDVHSSIDSLKLELKCLATDEWLNKIQYAYMHILSHKKESSTNICHNVDEPQKHYAS